MAIFLTADLCARERGVKFSGGTDLVSTYVWRGVRESGPAFQPSLTMLSSGFKLFRLFRLNKALKALKFLRYSHSFELILNVIKREKRALAAVCVLAGGYIALSALIMFQVEPDSFDTFFDAIYWAVVTLTTVGYGDIYPTSEIGRIVSMMSSFMGIAIVALPTGIITAGYMRELSREKWD